MRATATLIVAMILVLLQSTVLELAPVHIVTPACGLLVRGAQGVFTDSGGLQKEAFFLQKPCVTLRSETEWTELVDLGVNIVAGIEPDAIVAAWRTLRARRADWSARPYGEGDAGERIVSTLVE